MFDEERVKKVAHTFDLLKSTRQKVRLSRYVLCIVLRCGLTVRLISRESCRCATKRWVAGPNPRIIGGETEPALEFPHLPYYVETQLHGTTFKRAQKFRNREARRLRR